MKYDDLNNSYNSIKEYVLHLGYIAVLIAILLLISAIGDYSEKEMMKEAISEYEQENTTTAIKGE